MNCAIWDEIMTYDCMLLDYCELIVMCKSSKDVYLGG